eukprot:1094842-Amphidinium_carterae.1
MDMACWNASSPATGNCTQEPLTADHFRGAWLLHKPVDLALLHRCTEHQASVQGVWMGAQARLMVSSSMDV